MNKRKSNLITTATILVVYLVIQGLISTEILDQTYQVTLITICINLILAMGLNLIIGVAGQFSLGHAGFMSIGAYSCAIVLVRMPNMLGFVLGVIVGVIIASLVALIVAIPTLRLKGDYLAIATLGISEIIRIAVLNLGITNGAAGISNIPEITSFTLVFIFIILTSLIILNYAISSSGRATIAIREDEIAAEAMGINTTKYKSIAFIIGALTASMAGALYSAYFTLIKPETFGFMKSVDILIIVVFGGIGSMSGTIVAAILLGVINYVLQDYGDIRMILYALALIGIMIFRPGGLFGNKEFPISKFLMKRGATK